MAKFKIESKFHQGQTLYAVYEGKIISGKAIGFNPQLISEKNYALSPPEIEIGWGLNNNSESAWIPEDLCFKSMRALMIHLKS